MLTVDLIRKELARTGELPVLDEEEKEMGSRTGARKESRPIPEEIKSRWIWMARSAELAAALKDRFGVKEDLSEKSQKDMRTMLQKLVGKKRPKNPPSPDRVKATGPRAGRATKPDKGGKPRLILAETFPCPSCGAQLMIERG